MQMKVHVTDAAAAVVRRVRDSGRDDLVMVLSNGCCDSTAPFLYDHYVAEAGSEPVGAVDGVEILAPAWIRKLYDDDELTVDVNQSPIEDSFSLETDHGYRFVLRAPGNSGLG